MTRIWLVKDAEPLPIGGNTHRMRMGMLADQLVSRGADVTWWHSTFNHFTKSYYFDTPQVEKISSHYRIRFLESGRYDKHISFSRFLHHRLLAKQFIRQSALVDPPDVIVCTHPIPSFAAAAVKYAKLNGIPVLVDVRDLWPDIFVHKSPAAIKPVIQLLTYKMRKQTSWVMKNASAIIAVSDSYIKWAACMAGYEMPQENHIVLPIGFQRVTALKSGFSRIKDLLVAYRSKTIVTFVGSFSHSYDLETVAKAATSLWNEGQRDIIFVLAGDGQQAAGLKKYASKVGNIILTGWLNREEMDDLLKLSDMGLVCCHSLAGTMPNKIFQYLCFGLPIISSLVGDSENLINETGIGSSYKVGDVEGLKLTIKKLASDKDLLTRIKLNAKSIFDDRFDAEKIYEKYSEIVFSLAGSKN
jgi:glycosyltransferase involved in cell wall biosynthesis